QSDSRLTMTGDLVGTLRYMSPEQALAKRVAVDQRTDIYSLGATLYEMLTLEPVFGGEDRQELLRQIAFEEPRPLRQHNKAIPRELETIVLKALAKKPAERYATAQELADDLNRFLEDRPIVAKRPTLVQRLRKWARRHQAVVTTAVIASVLCLAALSGVAGWVLQERAGRLARTDEKAGEALDESARHQDRGAIPEALEAIAKAEAALAAGGGDETLRDRVARRRHDLEMVRQLEDVVLDPRLWDSNDVEVNDAQICVLFAQAFRDHGIDVEKL